MMHYIQNSMRYFKVSLTFILFILSIFMSIYINNSFIVGSKHIQNSKTWDINIDPKNIAHLSLGYANVIVVIQWMKTLSNYGNLERQTTLEDTYYRLRMITALNPSFEPAYYLAALLPWETNSTVESDIILSTAIKNMPDTWYWPYYKGFNAYWFNHDLKLASKLLFAASRLSNAPLSVRTLALRMTSDSGELHNGLAILDQLLNSIDDANMRKNLLDTRVKILTEIVLQNIDEKLSSLNKRTFDYRDLLQLTKRGIHIPKKLPDDGHIIFDTKGHIVSSIEKKRFKIFIPPKRQGVIHHEPVD